MYLSLISLQPEWTALSPHLAPVHVLTWVLTLDSGALFPPLGFPKAYAHPSLASH